MPVPELGACGEAVCTPEWWRRDGKMRRMVLANAPLHVGTSTFCTKMPVMALHVNGEIILHPLLEPTAAP